MPQQKHIFLPNLLDKLGTHSKDISPRHSNYQYSIKPSKTLSLYKNYHNQLIQQRQSISILLNNLPQSKQNHLLTRLLTQNQSKNKSSKTKIENKQLFFQRKYNLQMNCMVENLNVKHINRLEKSQLTTNKHVNKTTFSIKSSLLTNEKFNSYHQKLGKKISIKEDEKQNLTKQSNQKNENKIKFFKKLKPLNQLSTKLFPQNPQNLLSCPRQRQTQKLQIRQCFSQMRNSSSTLNNQKEKLFNEIKFLEGNILPWQINDKDSQKEQSLVDIFVNEE